MHENHKIPGAIIRRERLRRGIEQKALCHGVCAPSYLSKIERGAADPDPEIIRTLYARLGLAGIADEATLRRVEAALEECRDRVNYGLPTGEAGDFLRENREAIANSAFAPDLFILRGFTDWDALDECIAALTAMDACLTPKQLACLLLLRWRQRPLSREELPALETAVSIVGTALALNGYAAGCFACSDFAAVVRLEDRLSALALREGSVYQLATYYATEAAAYSCMGLVALMTDCAERAIHLLRNTGWQSESAMLYYNVGATMLELGRYDEAERCLAMAEGAPDRFLLDHKRALLAIRRGDADAGRAILEGMRSHAQDDLADALMLEEAEWELMPDFLAEPGYLETLDRLIAALRIRYHKGFTAFYRGVYTEACVRQRQYRRAYAFERLLSSDAQ